MYPLKADLFYNNFSDRPTVPAITAEPPPATLKKSGLLRSARNDAKREKSPPRPQKNPANPENLVKIVVQTKKIIKITKITKIKVQTIFPDRPTARRPHKNKVIRLFFPCYFY